MQLIRGQKKQDLEKKTVTDQSLKRRMNERRNGFVHKKCMKDKKEAKQRNINGVKKLNQRKDI